MSGKTSKKKRLNTLLEAIRDAGEPLTLSALTETTGINRTQISSELGDAVRDGIVVTTRNNSYESLFDLAHRSISPKTLLARQWVPAPSANNFTPTYY